MCPTLESLYGRGSAIGPPFIALSRPLSRRIRSAVMPAMTEQQQVGPALQYLVVPAHEEHYCCTTSRHDGADQALVLRFDIGVASQASVDTKNRPMDS
jgi:hypothetical protein